MYDCIVGVWLCGCASGIPIAAATGSCVCMLSACSDEKCTRHLAAPSVPLTNYYFPFGGFRKSPPQRLINFPLTNQRSSDATRTPVRAAVTIGFLLLKSQHSSPAHLHEIPVRTFVRTRWLRCAVRTRLFIPVRVGRRNEPQQSFTEYSLCQQSMRNGGANAVPSTWFVVPVHEHLYKLTTKLTSLMYLVH